MEQKNQIEQKAKRKKNLGLLLILPDQAWGIENPILA